MIGLTPTQRKLYDFIAAEIAGKGIAPSLDEMGAAIGISKSRAFHLLVALEERGYIRRIPHRARAIELVKDFRAVTLNPEILALTDRYALEHRITRETAVNELIRAALEAA